MRERALRDVAQLSDKELFATLAEGMDHISATRGVLRGLGTHGGSRAWPELRRASEHAEEEAAKYLILLDAVRCPRQGSRFRTTSLDFTNISPAEYMRR